MIRVARWAYSMMQLYGVIASHWSLILTIALLCFAWYVLGPVVIGWLTGDDA